MEAQPNGCASLFSGIEARNQIADDGVALAGGVFKPFAIEDLYVAAAVLDEAAALQHTRCQGNAGTSCAEHFSQEFLG